jgi:hypothetical protein
MSKRRTRKDKEKAIHHFTLSWENKPEKASVEPPVKTQIKNVDNSINESGTLTKKTLSMAKDDMSGSTKHRIFKSLILVSLILGIEVVIYFIWNA